MSCSSDRIAASPPLSVPSRFIDASNVSASVYPNCIASYHIAPYRIAPHRTPPYLPPPHHPGNKKLTEGQFAEAIELYTKVIAMARVPCTFPTGTLVCGCVGVGVFICAMDLTVYMDDDDDAMILEWRCVSCLHSIALTPMLHTQCGRVLTVRPV